MRATWTDQGPPKRPGRGETVVVEEELLRVTLPHDLRSSNLAETGKPFLTGAFSPTSHRAHRFLVLVVVQRSRLAQTGACAR